MPDFSRKAGSCTVRLYCIMRSEESCSHMFGGGEKSLANLAFLCGSFVLVFYVPKI